jgi:ankyrin repeat protein
LLAVAAEKGDFNGVQELLKWKYFVQKDMISPKRVTPLYHAARNGHVAVVELLLEAGVSPFCLPPTPYFPSLPPSIQK